MDAERARPPVRDLIPHLESRITATPNSPSGRDWEFVVLLHTPWMPPTEPVSVEARAGLTVYRDPYLYQGYAHSLEDAEQAVEEYGERLSRQLPPCVFATPNPPTTMPGWLAVLCLINLTVDCALGCLALVWWGLL